MVVSASASRSRLTTGNADRPHVPVQLDVAFFPRQSQPRGHGVEAELRAWVGPCVERLDGIRARPRAGGRLSAGHEARPSTARALASHAARSLSYCSSTHNAGVALRGMNGSSPGVAWRRPASWPARTDPWLPVSAATVRLHGRGALPAPVTTSRVAAVFRVVRVAVSAAARVFEAARDDAETTAIRALVVVWREADWRGFPIGVHTNPLPCSFRYCATLMRVGPPGVRGAALRFGGSRARCSAMRSLMALTRR